MAAGSLLVPDGDRGAGIDPVVEEFGGIALVEREADAPVGGRSAGNGFESVDEDVAGDLDAPGHPCVAIAGRVVDGLLVGAGLEASGWSGAVAAGADAGAKDESVALPGAELLLRKVDLDAFRRDVDREVPVVVFDVGKFGVHVPGHGGSDRFEVGQLDERGAVGEVAQLGCAQGVPVEMNEPALPVVADRPTKMTSGLLKGEVDCIRFLREGDPVCPGGRGVAGRSGHDEHEREEAADHGGEADGGRWGAVRRGIFVQDRRGSRHKPRERPSRSERFD